MQFNAGSVRFPVLQPLTTDQLLAFEAIAVDVLGLLLVTWQIRQHALAARGDTYNNLCGLSYEILVIMADQPSLYPFFTRVRHSTRVRSTGSRRFAAARWSRTTATTLRSSGRASQTMLAPLAKLRPRADRPERRARGVHAAVSRVVLAGTIEILDNVKRGRQRTD